MLMNLLKVKAQLEADKAAIRKGQVLSTRALMAKYDAKIKEYESFLMEKDTLIAQLERDNGTLKVNNETLNSENTKLTY